MPNDKVKILYDAISKDYDLGSYDEFVQKLSDPQKRKAFYDGVGQQYSLGSFEEFESKVALKKKEQPTVSTSENGSLVSKGYNPVPSVTEVFKPSLEVPEKKYRRDVDGNYYYQDPKHGNVKVGIEMPNDGILVGNDNIPNVKGNPLEGLKYTGNDRAYPETPNIGKYTPVPAPERNTQEDLNKSLKTITPKLIDYEEEKVVPQLNYEFSGHGFKFEETGKGDAMTVTAPNGKTTTIDLDPFLSKTEVAESKKLQNFIKENQRDYSKFEKIQSNYDNYNKKFLDQKEIDNAFATLSEDTQKLSQETKVGMAKLKTLTPGSPEYNQITDDLSKQQAQYERNKAALENNVGRYVAMKAEQGTYLGGIYNSFLEGTGEAASGLLGLAIDSGIGQPVELPDETKKALKQAALPKVREALVKNIGDQNTSKEWVENAGFVHGAILGLARSVPAMVGGTAGMLPLMYAQVSDNLDKQMMDDPDFKDISENEKMLVKVPLGIATAALERYGFRNVIESKGLLNDLVLKAIGNSTSKTTAKGFNELIENEIQSELAKGVLRVGAGGLAEFETGASQEIVDITAKQIYNAVKEKDMFDTPESAGAYLKQVFKAGAQEAIGGLILGSVPAVSKAWQSKNFKRADNSTIEAVNIIGNDPQMMDAVQSTLNIKVNTGEITPEEGEAQMDDLRSTIGVINQLPSDMTIEQQKEAIPIRKKLNDLETQKEKIGKAKGLTEPIQMEIDKANEKLLNITGFETVEGETGGKKIKKIPLEDALNKLDETIKTKEEGTRTASKKKFKPRYDRQGNEIGDGSFHTSYSAYEFPDHKQVGVEVSNSETTESVYVTYTNKENGKSITTRFSDHENNATKFGDQLDGNFATRDEILFHLGLKKRTFVPDKFLNIVTRQVSKKDLEKGEYEEADKTIKELYDLGAGADISEYKGKLAKGSNYLIQGDKVTEEVKRKNNYLGTPVEIGKYIYEDNNNETTKSKTKLPEAQTRTSKTEGQKNEDVITVYHHTSQDGLALNPEEGTWFTDNKNGVPGRSGKGTKVIEETIKPSELNLATNKQFLEVAAKVDSWKERAALLKEQGFDGVKRKVDGDNHYWIFDKTNPKGQKNEDVDVVNVTTYDQGKELAHAVKNMDKNAIVKMAKDLSGIIPKNAIIIPMVSRTGRATNMLQVAKEIGKINGNRVEDILRGYARESLYDIKKKGGDISSLNLNLKLAKKIKGNIYVIDNVLATGATAKAIKKTIPNATIAVHSIDKTKGAETKETASKSLETKELESQLEKAQSEVTSLNDKIKSKSAELGKTFLEDQSNLFGERKSSEGKLFDTRVNPDQINKVIGDLKSKRDAAIRNVRDIKDKMAKVEKEGTKQQSIFDTEPKKVETNLPQDNLIRKVQGYNTLSKFQKGTKNGILIQREISEAAAKHGLDINVASNGNIKLSKEGKQVKHSPMTEDVPEPSEEAISFAKEMIKKGAVNQWLDIGMQPAEIKKAVEDINKGKPTKLSKRLINAIHYWQKDNGFVYTERAKNGDKHSQFVSFDEIEKVYQGNQGEVDGLSEAEQEALYQEYLSLNEEELNHIFNLFNDETETTTQTESNQSDGSNKESRTEPKEIEDVIKSLKVSVITTVADLADLDAEEQNGLISGAVFAALQKGDVLNIGGHKYVVEGKSKPTPNEYYTKDGKKVDYKKYSIKIKDDKGKAITGEYWEYKNGSGMWIGRGQTLKQNRWGQLSRDMEGDITVDLINRNNPFHTPSDSYKKAQEHIDNYISKLAADQQDNTELAKRIRDKKIKGIGVYLDFGITKTIYNSALEIAAREVEKGTKLGNAINKAIQWVDSKVGKNWNKGLFAKHLNDKFKVGLNGKEVEVERDFSKPTAELINGFYSPLEAGINKSKLDKATGKEWLRRLQGETEGDELKWTGVADYLNANADKVISKGDLLNHFKTNRVEIVEVAKGEPTQDDVDMLLKEEFAEGWSRDEAIDYLKNEENATKFSDYQVEGEKENYKEVLVLLPNKMTPLPFEVFWKENNPNVTEEVARERYRKGLERMKNEPKFGSQLLFKSTHWDEPNILVHLRMNTRTDSQGNKVLFIEEIQSDWGQKGKREGFVQDKLPTSKGFIDYRTELYEKYNVDNYPALSKVASPQENAILRTLFANENGDRNPLTPQAPFVTETPSWTKLGIKVALKEAVEQGVDKIAWTTGEQQNERYDLSKQVDEILYSKDSNGNYDITALRNKEIVVTQYDIEADKLESLVGKDVAQRMIDGEGIPPKPNSAEFKTTLKGHDLKVGGKGMIGFYGSPESGKLGIVGEVVKSLTGQEPKIAEIKVTEDKFVYDHHNTTVEETPKAFILKDEEGNSLASISKEVGSNYPPGQVRKQKLLEIARQNPDLRQKVTGNKSQHSIDITPELKKSVESGIPLFKGLTPDQQIQRGIEKFKDIAKGKIIRDITSIPPAILEALADVAIGFARKGGDALKNFISTLRTKYGEQFKNVTDKELTTFFNKANGISDQKKKTIATVRAYEGEIRDEVKKYLEEGGLYRETFSREERSQQAEDFIKKFGEDAALEAVKNFELRGALATSTLTRLILRNDAEMSKLTAEDVDKLDELGKKGAELIILLEREGYFGGELTGQLAYEYENSDIGYNVEKKIKEWKDNNGGEISPEVEARFREYDRELKEIKTKLAEAEKRAKEAEEQKAIIDIQESVQREKKEKVSAKIRRETDWITAKIKEAKIHRPGMFSAATPASLVWDGAIESVSLVIKATGRSAEAIAKGVEYIKKSDWYTSLSNSDQDKAISEFKNFWKEKPKPEVKKGKLKIPPQLIRDLVEGGIDNIEDLTESVKEIVEKDIPGATSRQVRDAITEYGKTVNLNQEEIAAQIRKMKRIGRILSGLEDIANKKRPLKSGIQRDKIKVDERAKLKELREAMKELPLDEDLLAEQMKTATDAAKQRLRNQIEDLQREIDKGELVPRSARTIQDDAELKELKEKRDKLKSEHEAIFKDEEFKNKKRLEQAKKRTAQKIEDLQRRIREKDFTVKKPSKLIDDSELIKLKGEKLRIQSKYDTEFYKNKLENRTKAEKVKDFLWDAWGLTRALRATGEFSFVLVQGLIQTIAHPKYAAKAFANALKSFSSESKTEKFLNEIKSQEWYPQLKQSKLALTESHAEVAAREELFFSDWTKMVWNAIGLPFKLKSEGAYEKWKAANPFKAIERAAVGYLDTLRVLRFLDGKQMLEEKGLTFEKNPEAWKEMADVINTFTGRASLGKAELFAPTLTKIFFSPRNWASVFKTASPYAFYHFGKKRAGAEGWKPSVAQKMALADYAKFVGLTTAFMMMAKLYFDEDDDETTGVEMDPTSSDYMKIKIGRKRIDPWGGRQQEVVLLARLISQSIKKESGEKVPLGVPFKTPTMGGLLIQRATNKLAPSAAMFYKYLDSRVTEDGRRLDTYGNEYIFSDQLKENLYPIYWGTLNDLLKDDPKALDGLLAFYSFFGGGVNVYDKKKPAKQHQVKRTPRKPKYKKLEPNY